MPKCHRSYCAAIVGALIALATGLHAQDHREQQSQAAPAQQTQERAQPPLPITITGPVRVEREKEVEPDWNSLKCGEAKNHDEADLCEQRRMAKSAEKTLELNELQVGLGFAGFLILAWTLLYVRNSTKAAAAAARAAEKAVTVASETAQRQLRAYVSSDFDQTKEKDIQITKAGCFIPMVAKNRGQTPGYGFIHWFKVAVLPASDCGPVHLLRNKRKSGDLPIYGPADIMPEERLLGRAMHPPFSDEQWEQMRARTHQLYIFGCLYYRDAFRRRRYTRYCYFVPMEPDGQFRNFGTYYKGNKSN